MLSIDSVLRGLFFQTTHGLGPRGVRGAQGERQVARQAGGGPGRGQHLHHWAQRHQGPRGHLLPLPSTDSCFYRAN